MNACKTIKCGNSEKLIRVRAQRREQTVFLRVRYGKSVRGGCTILRILKVEVV